MKPPDETAGQDPEGGAPGGRRARTQAERREESRVRLLKAAVRVVARKGVVKTTLADIGEHSGYSRGMVRERFGSKSGLMNLLAKYIRTSFVTEVLEPAVEGMSGVAAAMGMVDTGFRFVARDDTIVRALFSVIGEALVADPELRPGVAWVLQESRNRFDGYIREARDAGAIPETVAPDLAARLIVAVWLGIMIQHLIDPEELDLESFRERTVEMITRLGVAH